MLLHPQDLRQEQEKRKVNTGVLNTNISTKNYLFPFKFALFYTVPDIKIETKVLNPNI